MVAVEQALRVVLDAVYLATIQRFASGKGIVARFELEAQEIGRRHELRFSGELSELAWVGRGCRSRGFRSCGRVVFGLVAILLASDPLLLVLQALGFAQRDAVVPDGAADERAVPDVPRVVAHHSVQPGAARAQHLGDLVFIQDVLLELAPVLVAAGEHVRHEAVEAGLGARRCGGEAGAADDTQQEQHQQSRDAEP